MGNNASGIGFPVAETPQQDIRVTGRRINKLQRVADFDRVRWKGEVSGWNAKTIRSNNSEIERL